jgi:hypothetical protein
MRTLVCAVVAVVIGVGAAQAADKKAKPVMGKVKKVDAANGTLTVTVKKKKETEDKEFKIADTTKVFVMDGDEKKEAASKDILKSEQLKEGVDVAIVADETGKVTELTIGAKKKKKKDK